VERRLGRPRQNLSFSSTGLRFANGARGSKLIRRRRDFRAAKESL
jgi:hypothetical protein